MRNESRGSCFVLFPYILLTCWLELDSYIPRLGWPVQMCSSVGLAPTLNGSVECQQLYKHDVPPLPHL